MALGLDTVGERWALLIVRELLLGPKRFGDLRAGLPGASADMVTVRLRELESHGVVRRRRLPAPASAWVYELTEWGADLEPVVVALARWGVRSPEMAERADEPLGVDSAVLSLRVLFDPGAAADATLAVGLVVDEQPFRLHVDRGRLEIARGAAPDAAVLLTTDPHTLAALVQGARDVDGACRSGHLGVTGDPGVGREFFGFFATGGRRAAAG